MYPIRTMCRVLEVSSSAYYAWRKREPSARSRANAALLETITAIHVESDGTYGAPRIHADLPAKGASASLNRVARVMRAAGIRGVSRRKWTTTTVRGEDTRPAPDLVDRNFTATGPDQVWVADITYIPTWAGFVYLAIVLDVWSRRVVGWAMETHLRTELVLKALDMAVWRRRPTGVIHHSDQGTQGGFKRSSQRLEREELRWNRGSVDGRIVRCARGCVHQVVRRLAGESTVSTSGNRSPRERRVRKRQWMREYRPLSERVGSASMAGCNPIRMSHCRVDIWRSSNERRSPSFMLKARACVRSHGSCVGHPRRSRGSFGATPQLEVGTSNTAPRPRSGTRTGGRDARRWPSSPPTTI
jgi:putative transposase